jgi:hypothetical protein
MVYTSSAEKNRSSVDGFVANNKKPRNRAGDDG